MDKFKKIYPLWVIMLTVSVVIGGITIGLLYFTHFEDERQRLVETIQNQVGMIAAITHDVQGDHRDGNRNLTISQITEALNNINDIGGRWEFLLAERQGDQIIFFLQTGLTDIQTPEPVPVNSDLAEPTHHALLGESDTMIGNDYLGRKVLAAFEPIPNLRIGLVAKVTLAAIREPFVQTVWVSMAVMGLLLVIATGIFTRASIPLISRIDQSEAQLRESEARLLEAQRIAHVGNWNWDILTNELI